MAFEKITFKAKETKITAAFLNALQDAVIDTASPIVNHSKGEVITLTDSTERPLCGFKIYGKTIQNGTPTPEAPCSSGKCGR